MEKRELSAVPPFPRDGDSQVPLEIAKQDANGATEPIRLTDGRNLGDWKSRWPWRVWVQVAIETAYVASLLVLSFSMLFAGWVGLPDTWLSVPIERANEFSRYWHYCFAGLLGGTVFGVKWLYHSVAKGLWNVDRVIWRLLSPWMSFCLAFAVSLLMTSGSVSTQLNADSSAAWMSFGFLVGYFSDTAIGKMQEVAYVLFGGPRNPPPRTE